MTRSARSGLAILTRFLGLGVPSTSPELLPTAVEDDKNGFSSSRLEFLKVGVNSPLTFSVALSWCGTPFDSPDDFDESIFCPAGTLIGSSEAWISRNSCLTSWKVCCIVALFGVGVPSSPGSGDGDCQPLTDRFEGVNTTVLAAGYGEARVGEM